MNIKQDCIESIEIVDQTTISSRKVTVSGVMKVAASGKLVIENSEFSFAKGASIVCEGAVKFLNSSFAAINPNERWGGISLNEDGAAGSVFDKCVFKNAESQNSDEKCGGAITIIRVEDQPVKIRNCSFSDNVGNLGGGVCIHGTLMPGATDSPKISAILENCLFEKCSASNGGALSLIHRAKAEVLKCSFIDCRAQSAGAIYLYDYSELNATACSFENCKAEVAGGAITSRFSTVNLNRSIVKACVGTRDDTQGGAHYFEKSNSKISGDRFFDCHAQAGGAIRPIGGILKLERCEFENCSASVAGGAIAFSRDCESEIKGCKFIKCSKQSPTGTGHSIAFKDSSGNVQNCVFSECKSIDIADEVAYGPDSTVKIVNCEMPRKSVMEKIASLFHSSR
ncbi:MAG: right-handed parallel beta-helix repeat-containing protein [Candidatus Riflebacteria bacterium]|nr:right-handed parallel beta-helix repeat-containing protein [Candidatus Riflebacteria bacterium]